MFTKMLRTMFLAWYTRFYFVLQKDVSWTTVFTKTCPLLLCICFLEKIKIWLGLQPIYVIAILINFPKFSSKN